MPYVSCMYAPEDETLPTTKQGENARIVCTDENGVNWWLTEDSQVGDWLRYVEEGGEVLEYDEATYETWQNQPQAKPAEAQEATDAQPKETKSKTKTQAKSKTTTKK
jgi:hypothetical protein